MGARTSTVEEPHRGAATVSHRTRRIRIRSYQPGDDHVVDAVFAGMSPGSRRLRYLTALDELPGPARTALRQVDGERHVVLIAEGGRGRSRRPIGLARYVVDAPGRAEVAYEVVDSWQGRGVGSRLVGALVDAARSRGLQELHATVLPENGASLAILQRHLPTLRVRHVAGMLEVSAALAAAPIEAADVLADLQRLGVSTHHEAVTPGPGSTHVPVDGVLAMTA
jgi:GNAT superfamily N-acetyltransferase